MPNLSNAQYCAKLYEKHGRSFLENLNGEFAGLIYNRKKSDITLFADRVGSRPIYYMKTNGSLIFSTNIQSILKHPQIDVEMDVEMLAEFLSGKYSPLGTKTIFKGIKELHPGSKLLYKIKENATKNKIYWQPKYKPKNKPFSYFLKKFKKIISKAVEERIHDEDLDYGLFISGGSDSRLLASLIDKEIKCYHANEYMNREAKISKKVAIESGHKFEFLKRDKDCQEKVLEESGKITNFNSWFTSGHFLGFSDKISKEVDVILTGTWADTLLQGHHLPTKKLNIPVIRESLSVPMLNKKNPIEFLSSKFNQLPAYYKSQNSIKKIINKNVIRNNSCLKSHGIKFGDKINLIHSGITYPITNAPAFFEYFSNTQITKTEYPFLDNRIIDLSLEMPWKYHLRKNIVKNTITKIDPKITKISRGDSFLPMSSPYLMNFASRKLTSLKRKVDLKNHHGPWADREKIIRETDLAYSTIKEKGDPIKKCEFLDHKLIMKSYEDHINGLNNTNKLVPIISFIKPNIMEEVLG